MEQNGRKKGAIWRWTLRIFLTVACVATLVFIFANSLQTGEESAQQSSTMVDVVQDVASVIAPNSPIATATGAAYDRLHAYVRAVAHFAEFALFGALLIWCVLSYTWRREGIALSAVGVLCVPIIDETLQRFVSGRGAEFCDVCVDIAGGICGILFAVVVTLCIVCVQDNKRKKAQAEARKNG